ncbi:hypothetical protein DUNSADRAFT_320 [Dunaliella salina]|uniref:Uncharacterized protein n=1 Tax=Dunaliella salina TaxID=3046 RepID=A0ABQ7FZ72_DUNSA|nr:hypothetical protein DUNSADRAFT_320 [Dunaliella salina]|eukprot:KAF5827647.1 hypothetical protein DUNSADRAFT_320 [Dunaliella salina]
MVPSCVGIIVGWYCAWATPTFSKHSAIVCRYQHSFIHCLGHGSQCFSPHSLLFSSASIDMAFNFWVAAILVCSWYCAYIFDTSTA